MAAMARCGGLGCARCLQQGGDDGVVQEMRGGKLAIGRLLPEHLEPAPNMHHENVQPIGGLLGKRCPY